MKTIDYLNRLGFKTKIQWARSKIENGIRVKDWTFNDDITIGTLNGGDFEIHWASCMLYTDITLLYKNEKVEYVTSHTYSEGHKFDLFLKNCIEKYPNESFFKKITEGSDLILKRAL